MLKNNNGNVVKVLSKLGLKTNKLRNLFAGIVIALAAFLLTLSSLLVYNTTESFKSVANFQGVYQNASAENLLAIASNPVIEKYGVSQKIGSAASDDGSKKLAMSYGDSSYLEFVQYSFDSGQLPENASEVALEKDYAPGLSVGDSIDLDYRNFVTGKTQSGTFQISGIFSYINTQENQTKFMSFFSRDMITNDLDLGAEGADVILEVKDPLNYSGEEMKALIETIALDAGMSADDAFPNTAYLSYNTNFFETFAPIFLIGIVVLIACSLVIYNIFYISIIQKVKEYGQLRTIGTTKKQVRQIVYREGISLAVRYIPIGALLAAVVAYFVNPKAWIMYADSMIVIGACILTFLTIMLSVRKPAKTASEASPIDAAKYTGITQGKRETKNSKKRITPTSLGRDNLSQNRKKTMLTFSSLILSGTMLIVMATLIGAINPERMLRSQEVFRHGSSYNLTFNNELLSPKIWYNNLQVNNPLSETLEKSILETPQVEHIYVKKELVAYVADVSQEGGQTTLESIDDSPYGIASEDIVEGSLEAVQRDELGILVNRSAYYYELFQLNLHVGDQIKLTLMDGENPVEKTFTVQVIVDRPSDKSVFFSTREHMDNLVSESPNFAFEVITKEGYQGEAAGVIEGLIAGEERLNLRNFNEEVAVLGKNLAAQVSVAYGLIALIAIFALVNLVNTIITNIITRKYEIGVLQSVGLTNKQLVSMLNTESFAYTFGSFIIATVIGCLLGFVLSNAFGSIRGLSHITYTFPALIIGVYLVIMVLLQVVITVIMKNYLSKNTVIERLSQK